MRKKGQPDGGEQQQYRGRALVKSGSFSGCTCGNVSNAERHTASDPSMLHCSPQGFYDGQNTTDTDTDEDGQNKR